jgi:hypothetical protein
VATSAATAAAGSKARNPNGRMPEGDVQSPMPALALGIGHWDFYSDFWFRISGFT